MNDVIEVANLYKRYGETMAVSDISLRVRRGEIFAIVGPNGAGKTTTVEMVAGLRRPDGGTVRVLGLDPHRDDAALRQRIGVQLQQAALPDRLRVGEAVDLFATFFRRTVSGDRLLEAWGLAERRQAAFANLSGGQQQRLFIVLALLNDPEVVFLDELTTGLDPQARRATWEAVRAIRERGKTVVLVTHFMDEAQALADRVAIVDRGALVALDTPAALIAGLHAGSTVHFTMANGYDPAPLGALPGVRQVTREGARVSVRGDGPLLARVATALAGAGVEPLDLRLDRADLEDVFLALTGRRIRA